MAKELGKKGGQETLKKYGTEHFRRIINKRWANQKGVQKERDKVANFPA